MNDLRVPVTPRAMAIESAYKSRMHDPNNVIIDRHGGETRMYQPVTTPPRSDDVWANMDQNRPSRLRDIKWEEQGQLFATDARTAWAAVHVPEAPKRLFHGSATELKVGDKVLPGSAVGKANFDYSEDAPLRHHRPVEGHSQNDVVWTTPHRSAARYFAEHAAGNPAEGRTFMYEVEPTSTVHLDKTSGMQSAYTTDAARVKRAYQIDLFRNDRRFRDARVHQTGGPGTKTGDVQQRLF